MQNVNKGMIFTTQQILQPQTFMVVIITAKEVLASILNAINAKSNSFSKKDGIVVKINAHNITFAHHVHLHSITEIQKMSTNFFSQII